MACLSDELDHVEPGEEEVGTARADNFVSGLPATFTIHKHSSKFNPAKEL